MINEKLVVCKKCGLVSNSKPNQCICGSKDFEEIVVDGVDDETFKEDIKE